VWLVVVALLALAQRAALLGRLLGEGLIRGWRFGLQSHPSLVRFYRVERVEADRVLVYLGFFLAAFLIAQTDQRRQRFGEGIAIGLALIAFLALSTRLLPTS
jgi:hypothetical protein